MYIRIRQRWSFSTEWVEHGRSQWIDRLCVFSARMAGSAPRFGRAVCPPVGLSIRGIGLALQDGALFGCKCLCAAKFRTCSASARH
jgi:hypothetical protein